MRPATLWRSLWAPSAKKAVKVNAIGAAVAVPGKRRADVPIGKHDEGWGVHRKVAKQKLHRAHRPSRLVGDTLRVRDTLNKSGVGGTVHNGNEGNAERRCDVHDLVVALDRERQMRGPEVDDKTIVFGEEFLQELVGKGLRQQLHPRKARNQLRRARFSKIEPLGSVGVRQEETYDVEAPWLMNGNPYADLVGGDSIDVPAERSARGLEDFRGRVPGNQLALDRVGARKARDESGEKEKPQENAHHRYGT